MSAAAAEKLINTHAEAEDNIIPNQEEKVIVELKVQQDTNDEMETTLTMLANIKCGEEDQQIATIPDIASEEDLPPGQYDAEKNFHYEEGVVENEIRKFNLSHLDEETKEKLTELLIEYHEIFSLDNRCFGKLKNFQLELLQPL